MGDDKRYSEMYVVSNAGGEIIVTPLKLREVREQGRTVYRTKTGTTYSARSVKKHSDLSVAERRAYAEQQYQKDLDAIQWAIAKDSTLESLREAWIADARKRRDERNK